MRTAILATLALLAACDTDDAATVCESARAAMCRAMVCDGSYGGDLGACVADAAADGMCVNADEVGLDWTPCLAGFRALSCPATDTEISDAIIACHDSLDAQK